MTDPDSEPKLRLVEEPVRLSAEGAERSDQVVRLSSGEGDEPKLRQLDLEVVERVPRIESSYHDSSSGRSIEPDLDMILERKDMIQSLESKWGGEAETVKQTPHGWFILIGLLVVGALFMGYRSTEEGKVKVEEVKLATDTKLEDDKVREVEANQLIKTVSKEVKGYLEAKTIERKLAHVRQPERVRPLMEDWYRRFPMKSEVFHEMASFDGLNFQMKPFWRVQAATREGEVKTLLLEQITETEAKIDWETDVLYQPMDWDRFVEERITGQSFDFRVRLRPDSFYSHEFADDRKWACFQMAVPGGDYLFGYVPRDGEVFEQLKHICSQIADRTSSCIVRIRTPEGVKSPRGVLIETLVSPNWVIVDNIPGLSGREPEKR